jgi:hypothetical protein
VNLFASLYRRHVIVALYANSTCTDESVRCALYELSDSLNRDPWMDTLLTLLATLVGAIMGALFAWLFSRNLASQERKAREQELNIARAERERERESEYLARMRREWPHLVPAFRELANAERERVDAARTQTHLPGHDTAERLLRALTNATERLYITSSIAVGDDHTVVTLLGHITATYTPHSEHGVRVLDETYGVLVDFVTTPPEEESHAKERFASDLKALLADAREFLKQRKF